jgi:hypothetical protein
MWTAIMLSTATWLVVAPAVLHFSTASLLGSVLSGVIAGVLVLMRRWGGDRFLWVAFVGVYNVVVGFAWGGEARWSALAAGAALAFAGMMALKQHAPTSPERPA